MTTTELISSIDTLVVNYLKAYLDTLENFSSSVEGNVIEVQCKKNKDDNSRFMLLRMGINFENEEFYIYNIYIPNEDRKQGLGFGLISFIYEIAKTMRFALVLADMTDSFREKMIKRGAKETSIFDYLQIVDTTKLT
ncbi:MAG: hypothetical protein RIC35_13380 [Marinoscillum sp.]